MTEVSSEPPVPSDRMLEGTSRFQREYAPRGAYQSVDTRQTLREGLAEYYVVNAGLSDPAEMEHAPSAHYFRCHDLTHVIFGTHTGPLDEGVNDLFTLFGVDISFFRYIYLFLRTTEAKTVAKEYASFSQTFALLVGTLKLFPKVWRTGRAMQKKWPWEPPDTDLDRPIVELRREYGISIWRPEVALEMHDEQRGDA